MLGRTCTGMVICICSMLSENLLATTYTAIVQGLAGEDYYQTQFDERVAAIQGASESSSSDAEVELFTGDQATKENLLAWFQRLADQSTDKDRITLFYVGHGSYDGSGYKFNLPGPDLTGVEFKEAMSAVSAELKLIVNTSSSSGALLEAFEDAPNTVLLSATKSGRERNAPRFGRFLVKALADDSADLDKNESISAKEAFDYAQSQTEDFYTSEGLIATEHAVLQGDHANLITIARLSDRSARADNPELAERYSQRDQIDLEIERLRIRRIGMSDEAYRSEFQPLLIRLSLLQAEIDELEGVTP